MCVFPTYPQEEKRMPGTHEEKVAFLKAERKKNKDLTVAEAEKLLKDKFGSSLFRGYIGTVLQGKTPKLPKPGTRKKAVKKATKPKKKNVARKVKRKPGKKKARKKPGPKPGKKYRRKPGPKPGKKKTGKPGRPKAKKTTKPRKVRVRATRESMFALLAPKGRGYSAQVFSIKPQAVKAVENLIASGAAADKVLLFTRKKIKVEVKARVSL